MIGDRARSGVVGDAFGSARRLRRRRRRTFAVLLAADISIVALIRTSHRGTHIAESVIFPGAGLFENYRLLSVGFALAVVAATVAWMSWGADWLVGAVWVAALVATVLLAQRGQPVVRGVAQPLRGSHEFPLVMAVIAAVAWTKSVLARLPGVRQFRRARQRRRDELGRSAASVVDTCRAASIAALAISAGAAGVDVTGHRLAITDARVQRRARRVGAIARWRFTGDPLRADQAHIRTALWLWGELSDDQAAGFVAEAGRRLAGVPASEAGWVRPVDAVLAAVALDEHGVQTPRWPAMLHDRWSLRNGHRPAWCYEPLGLVAGACPPWEHATLGALCRTRGWVGDADWAAVRRTVLGGAARHDGDAHDERLVAAGRLWLAYVDDEQARQVIGRRSVGTDRIAVALSQLARAVAAAARSEVGVAAT